MNIIINKGKLVVNKRICKHLRFIRLRLFYKNNKNLFVEGNKRMSENFSSCRC